MIALRFPDSLLLVNASVTHSTPGGPSSLRNNGPPQAHVCLASACLGGESRSIITNLAPGLLFCRNEDEDMRFWNPRRHFHGRRDSALQAEGYLHCCLKVSSPRKARAARAGQPGAAPYFRFNRVALASVQWLRCLSR